MKNTGVPYIIDHGPSIMDKPTKLVDVFAGEPFDIKKHRQAADRYYANVYENHTGSLNLTQDQRITLIEEPRHKNQQVLDALRMEAQVAIDSRFATMSKDDTSKSDTSCTFST